MRYMLLIYNNERARETLSAEEKGKAHSSALDYIGEATQRGIFWAADPLEPTSTATTVRTQDGRMMITDGPFAETKEQLAGYFILDCKDLDEALEWASKIPMGCGGGTGCVEVRPIRQLTPQAA